MSDVVEPLSAPQKQAVHAICASLRQETHNLVHQLGLDIDLSTPALTEEERSARNAMYRTAETLSRMETVGAMQAHLLTLSFDEIRYFNAWRRHYFLTCLWQQREYYEQALHFSNQVRDLQRSGGP